VLDIAGGFFDQIVKHAREVGVIEID